VEHHASPSEFGRWGFLERHFISRASELSPLKSKLRENNHGVVGARGRLLLIAMLSE
jgi:hypothetical protein